MNWDIATAAVARAMDERDTTWHLGGPIKKFVEGAKWQRADLRTGQSIERVANFLHNDDHGETIDHHDAVCERDRGGCDRRESYMDYARAVIDSLIGEE